MNPGAPTVGDQFTFGGTVARFESPNEQIGSSGSHFVVTAPERGEWLGNGCLILPDGKISFQMLLGPNDWAGEGHAVITGGTGAYRNARGEYIHVFGTDEMFFRFRRN